MPGTSTTYTIVVTNNGPSTVSGAPVTDTFPASAHRCTWTALGVGGASYDAGQRPGNINTTVNLATGGTVTFTVSRHDRPAATGTLGNTATVPPPAGVTDPTRATTAPPTPTR